MVNKENIYQRREVDLGEIVNRIKIEDHKNIPDIILTIGPCRSGTTALLRLFGATGIKSYYQPIKTILRWLLLDEDKEMTHTWEIPKSSLIYLKETLGPYTFAESKLNPLTVLSGVLDEDTMKRKIHVLIMGREPSDTWYSWKTYFANENITIETLFENFNHAYKTVEEIRQEAIKNSMKVMHFVYEASQYPEVAVASLFKRLGIENPPVLYGWNNLPEMGTEGSNIFLPDESQPFIVEGIHDKIKNADSLRFYRSKGNELSEKEKNGIMKVNLYDIYSIWRTQTQIDLNVAIN